MRGLLLRLAVLLLAIVAVMALADLGGGALAQLLLYLPGIDKVLHVGLGLGVFIAVYHVSRGSGVSLAGSAAIAVASSALMAVADEWQQRFAGQRSVEAADVAASLSGTGLGVAYVLGAARPRLAFALAAGAMAAGGTLTCRSHLETRDYNRGLLAERAGRKSDALRHYRAAVQAGVRHPEVYNALAWMMLETGEGDPDEAAGYAARSLALRPDNADALDTYGWALVQAGNAAAAIAPLEQAFEAKPGIYCIHYHLGMAYVGAGRHADGLRHLHRQIDEMPTTKEARLAAEALVRFGGDATR